MKYRTYIFIILLIGIILGSYYFFRKPSYITVLPKKGPINQVVYATGTIETSKLLKISSEIGGVIELIYKKEGATLNKGDKILSLDQTIEESEIKALQSEYNFLRKKIANQKILLKKKFTSQQDVDLLNTQITTLESKIKAKKELLHKKLILSPINGTLLRSDAKIGEHINPAVPCLWIGQEPKEIVAYVDEEDRPLIKIGQDILIQTDAFPNQIFHGKLIRIRPQGDPIQKNYKIRVSIKEQDKMRPGMTTEINIITQKKELTWLLPISCFDGKFIWIIKNNNIHKIEVKSGIKSENWVEIISPILIGTERVILKPNFN